MTLARRATLLVLAVAPGCLTSRAAPPPTPPASAASAAVEDEPAPAAPAPAPTPKDPTPATPAEQAEKAQAEDRPLGWIANEPLTAEELLVEWGDVASRDLYLMIDKLVSTRLALAEAARLNIRLDPAEVETRFTQERDELARRLAGDKGVAKDLDQAIAEQLGFEAPRYLERVRRATIRQMLAERAVRAASLSSETMAVRLIVVVDAETMQKVQDELAAGRDFAELAREYSVDDSKKDGGLVPFVVPQERSPLARLAFQTPVGQVAGPVEVSDHRFLIRVEERRAPVEGDWTQIESAVEPSLREHPVVDAEFLHWKLQMEGRYPIDLGPLWSLIGAAR